MTLVRALARPKPATPAQVKLIRTRLLPTWQTSAAIGQHCGLPARTVLAALKKFQIDWGLEMRTVRIDGHNQVHLWRMRQRTMVLGVTFSLPGDNDDEGEGATCP